MTGHGCLGTAGGNGTIAKFCCGFMSQTKKIRVYDWSTYEAGGKADYSPFRMPSQSYQMDLYCHYSDLRCSGLLSRKACLSYVIDGFVGDDSFRSFLYYAALRGPVRGPVFKDDVDIWAPSTL